jgi:hypothetical protein
MSNSTLLTVTVVLVLGHAGALLLSVVLRKRIGPVIWLNLVVASGVLLGPSFAANSNDLRATWLTGLEALTLFSCAVALGGVRLPVLLIWTEFAINFLLSAISLAFVIFLSQARFCC